MTPVAIAFDNLHVILGAGAVIAVCGAAVALGSLPQKLMGVLQLLETFGIVWLTAGVAPEDRLYLVDAKSIVVLIAYGAMCYRWPDRGLILMTGLQGFAVILHVSDWLDVSLPRSINGLLLNSTGWGMLFVLGTATALHVVHRIDSRNRT